MAEGSKPQQCHNCLKQIDENEKMICSQCNCTIYCSKRCQVRHWYTHKALCYAIKQAEVYFDQHFAPKTMYNSHIIPQQQKRIVDVIGKRCIVSCKFNETHHSALWDTGGQVSMVLDNGLIRICQIMK